ncbi:MAG TPA: hypothetical protein PKY59_07580 [Pyrinomonadaceae bacterium]|nr:hypothetical protein [Pyrinomonadaceae bacterium]
MKLIPVFLLSLFLFGCAANTNTNITTSNVKSSSATPLAPKDASTPNEVSNKSEDKSITAQLKAFAKEKYPDDYSMQKFVFDQQMEAYNFMQKQEDSDIKKFAQKTYPNDYNMQKFVFNQQTEAYNFMKKIPDSDVKSFAEKKYPEDYNMQKFVYEQQLNAKKEMEKK